MESFGRYRLQKRLGAGGMGEVFLAFAQGQETPVVVKRILPHLTQNPRFLKLFLDETRIASRLHHPNIAQIHELGEVEGRWFVAMEHVAGHDLRELLKRVRVQGGRVPLEVALALAAQVAKGLSFAHQASDSQGRALRIVHRDVSPHNILVSRKGLVKLIDFGVAKAANKVVVTVAGALKGKLPYMAPEQAHSQPVDARSDVFALGVVLWEMVCGRHLFRGKSDAATLRLVRECEVIRPSSIRRELPTAVESAMLKALKKAPAHRFQSAGEFCEALELLRANFPPPDLAKWFAEYDDVPGIDDADSSSDAASEEIRDAVSDEETSSQLLSRGTLPIRVRPEALRSKSSWAADADSKGEADGPSTNLKPSATSFVGRVAELADLHQWLGQGVRLLTIVGPGGIGKSRLAAQLGAQSLSTFEGKDGLGTRRGGVWWCDLSAATDVESICSAMARTLGVPLPPRDAVEQLGYAIASRGDVLLLADNFEAVVGHAEKTVGAWLRAAPKVRFLVASREALQISGEVVFELPPLRVPGAEEPAALTEAVELFVERAKAARSGFEPTAAELACIAQAVQKLDGLPLAIELAAARMSTLSPAEMLRRLEQPRFALLDEAPQTSPRHSSLPQATLRAAIDLSWKLLTSEEALALAQLSVFRGGFSTEAATAVLRLPNCADSFDVLMMLRAKSLVRAFYPGGEEATSRLGLFESIRQYAQEKLQHMGLEGAAVEAHAKYFLAWGEKVAAGAEGNKAQLDALELERDNVLAVFERAVRAAEPNDRALRAVLVLDPLLALRGPFGSHHALLDEGLRKVSGDHEVRAEGLEARGRVRHARGEAAEAQCDFEEMKRLARQAQNVAIEGRAEAHLAMVERRRGKSEVARQRCRRALELLGSAGDMRMLGRVHSILAGLAAEVGDEEEAMDSYRKALGLHRQVGDRRYEGVTLANWGVQQQALGLLEPAKASHQAALEIHRELGNRRSEGISHINLGDLSVDLEQPGQARWHYQNALTILRSVGARRFEGVALVATGALALQRGELKEAQSGASEGVAILQETTERRYEGLGRAVLGAACALAGHLREAQQEFGHAAQLLSQMTDPSLMSALALYRAHLELMRVPDLRTAEDVAALRARIEGRLAEVERPGRSDASHPSGAPSPVNRSDHVRAAQRSLAAAMARLLSR